MSNLTLTQASRDEFEAAYVDHLRSNLPNSLRTAEDVKALRNGQLYSGNRAYLNGCWQGWQLAQAGRNTPEAALENLCDQLDTAVFSGDSLDDPQSRALLAERLARWQRRIAELSNPL